MADPLDQLLYSGNSNSPEDKTLSPINRIALQNLFDTQPKRRSAYLKRLGFEMNPKDDNQYRPIGSSSGYSEIDPGFGDEFKKGGLVAVGKELLQDIGDIGFDTLVSAPAIGGGAAAGGVAGISGGPLAIPAAILGGGVGNAAAEGVKMMAGDVLLDENVPIDKQGLVLQSIFTGLAGPLLKGGTRLAKEGYGVFLSARKNAIINAAKQSGGGLTEDILNKAIQKPDMFTKEAVSGANDKLKQTYRSLFGIDDPLKLDAPESIRGGAFGHKMDVLNANANSEIERLSKEKAANFDVNEITGPMKKLASKLNDKYSKTADEEDAYSYLKQKISEIEKKSGGKTSSINPEIINSGGMSVAESVNKKAKQLSFKDAREFLTSIQSDMSKKDTAGNYVNPAGRVLAPAIGGGDGVLSILNKKAESVGSSLPEINSERSRVLQAYNTAAEVLTPTNITSAFVGNDTIKKSMIRDAASEIDSTLGSSFSKSIEDGSMQRVVENMYKTPKAFGSGRVNAEIAQNAIKQGVTGGVGGAAAGWAAGGKTGAELGGTLGAIGGAAKGAYEASLMSSPEKALEALGKTSKSISALSSNLASPQTIPSPVTLGAQEIVRDLTSSDSVNTEKQNQEDIDPLDALLGK